MKAGIEWEFVGKYHADNGWEVDKDPSGIGENGERCANNGVPDKQSVKDGGEDGRVLTMG